MKYKYTYYTLADNKKLYEGSSKAKAVAVAHKAEISLLYESVQIDRLCVKY